MREQILIEALDRIETEDREEYTNQRGPFAQIARDALQKFIKTFEPVCPKCNGTGQYGDTEGYSVACSCGVNL